MTKSATEFYEMVIAQAEASISALFKIIQSSTSLA